MTATNLTETTADEAKQSLFGHMMQDPAPQNLNKSQQA
jgi:hypothetical protein